MVFLDATQHLPGTYALRCESEQSALPMPFADALGRA
jgi:hypothetical protein